jgi:hypothetical protein
VANYGTFEFAAPAIGSSITVYHRLGHRSGTLNEPPISLIAGPKTLLNRPAGIVVGKLPAATSGAD